MLDLNKNYILLNILNSKNLINFMGYCKYERIMKKAVEFVSNGLSEIIFMSF